MTKKILISIQWVIKINNKKKIQIFILVGEVSGDVIASGLIKALKKNNSKVDIDFFGITGPRMVDLGVKSLLGFEKINYLGFSDVILNYIPLKLKLKHVFQNIINKNPDFIISIDAKLFSLYLAKKITNYKNKNFSPKLVHIVPPTIWAHSPSRAKKWKNIYDLIISIIPNEDSYFKQYGIETRYLGNPIYEEFLKKINYNKTKIKSDNNNCLILPGSRKKEIQNNLKILMKTIKKINQKYQNINWLLPTSDILKDHISKEIHSFKLHDCINIINFEDSYDEILNSKIAIACSGTVTLQLALASIPTISIYKTNFLNATIAKFFVNFDNVILPNFITGKKIIPLLFQNDFNVTNLFNLFCDYYENNSYYRKIFFAFSEELKQKINTKDNNFNYKLSTEIIKMIN